MDIIGKFGNMVGNEALKDPVKPAVFCLPDTGYRRKNYSFFRTESFRCPGSMRRGWS